MNTKFYADMMHDMLIDKKTYIESSVLFKKRIMKPIRLLVSKYYGVTEDEKDYITNFKSNTPKCYGLPKKQVSITRVVTQMSECIILETTTDMEFRPILAV